MLNPPTVYRETGRQAATCRRHYDEAGAQFHTDWFRKAKALELPEDRKLAQAEFDAGYAEAGYRKPEPFR